MPNCCTQISYGEEQSFWWNFYISTIKIMQHFFKAVKEKKHGFTSMILKTKHKQSNGYQEVEVVPSKWKSVSTEQRSWQQFFWYTQSIFLLTFWRSKENNNTDLLGDCFEKVSQSFSGKMLREASSEMTPLQQYFCSLLSDKGNLARVLLGNH